MLPAVSNVGQPISHRLDHLLSGVRAQIALKVYGDDLDTLRGLAADLRDRLARIPGITDLQIEKQVLIPQVKIRVDYEQAARYGVAPGNLLRSLEQMIDGERITQIIEGNRRFDLLVRLPETARGPQALAGLLIETPTGAVPLSKIASVEETDGPNQVSRENSRRRIVLSANTDGRDMSKVIADIRGELAARPLPEGYFTALEGQFQAQEQASRLIAVLATISLTMIFMVLYSRYRSATLTLIIMGNIPLALVGSVDRLVDLRTAVVGRRAGRLHHAHRHRHPQRHPEDQPLHQSVCFRGRNLRPADDRTRVAGAAHAGADDGAGGGLRACCRCCSRPMRRARKCCIRWPW